MTGGDYKRNTIKIKGIQVQCSGHEFVLSLANYMVGLKTLNSKNSIYWKKTIHFIAH